VKGRAFRALAGALALLNLGICLASAVLLFLGRITQGAYRTAFLLSSIAWFVFAVLWTVGRKGTNAN
jgi:hypothetical protein